MTRDELIRCLVDKQKHISYKLMSEAVKHLVDTMAIKLSEGERIEIRRFGSFALRYRAASLRRNPKTGEELQTPCKYAVHFKPGKELKERVNNAYKDVTS